MAKVLRVNAERLAWLASAEAHFIPVDLRRAADFLLAARWPAKGWGDYPHTQADLHVTAEVLLSLRGLDHDRCGEVAADVAAWAKTTENSGSILDLVDLLIIATVDGDASGPYADGLRQALRSASADLAEISTPTLARAILAISSDNADDLGRLWAEELVRRSRGERAWETRRAWEPAALPEESIPLTAWAVRALGAWPDLPGAEAALAHGLSYLHSHLQDFGWESPALRGTYPLTLVLRALTTDREGDPEVTGAGLGRLQSLQRHDGGWPGWSGEQQGTASAIEHTANAVAALTDAGACRYLPLTATQLVIREIQTSLETVERERAALEQHIDQEIERRLSGVLSERKQLKRQLAEQDKTIESLHSLTRRLKPSGAPIYPSDVRNKKFSTTRLRPGYDQEEVDAFLDKVESEIALLLVEAKSIDTAPPVSTQKRIRPSDVRMKQFSTTRLRPGYDEEEVDAFLDEVESEIEKLISKNQQRRIKAATLQSRERPSVAGRSSDLLSKTEFEVPGGPRRTRIKRSSMSRQVKWRLIFFLTTWIFGMALATSLDPTSNSTALSRSIALLLGATFAVAAFLIFGFWRGPLSVLRSAASSEPPFKVNHSLITAFASILSLRDTQREEIVYWLAGDGNDLPGDAFRRSFADLLVRLNVDTETRRDLLRWADLFVEADAADRPAVINQLRRAYG